MHYAHSTSRADRSDWQPLVDHLANVAELAAKFGAKFGAERLARLAGILHDLGKYSDAFQVYITGRGQGVTHSTAGAKEAIALVPAFPNKIGAELAAYAIAGHHSGLPNGSRLQPSLEDRLKEPIESLSPVWREQVRPDIDALLPAWTMAARSKEQLAFCLSFLGRMIFSCLVDADRLDTEKHAAEVEGHTIDRDWPALCDRVGDLIAGFDAHMAGKLAALPESARQSDLNRLRADILAHVRGKAGLPKGVFTLTVPTGGGKTLASLAFALDHARCHHMHRIIYAIPFTGAWIETLSWPAPRNVLSSRPLRGGVDRNGSGRGAFDLAICRPLRGGVDRNIAPHKNARTDHRSPPSRGRGSKPPFLDVAVDRRAGRPLRGGVDRNGPDGSTRRPASMASPPSRGRGSKLRRAVMDAAGDLSPPSRGRGSKLGLAMALPHRVIVAPFAGAWIETIDRHGDWTNRAGRPLRGGVDRNRLHLHLLGHGLGRPLRGGVDRNTIVMMRLMFARRRPLRGGVDRNKSYETSYAWATESPPSRGRGSKPVRSARPVEYQVVAPFAGAWIETTLS